ncbi:hypothetical protein Hdeb2414_s0013g00412571 [Helianthus debilis subsp. tardiflorus]
MDIQDHTTTPSGHTCRRCGWPFSPSSRDRDHKRMCGTVEGYTKVINDEAVSDDDDDEQCHFDYGDEEKEMITPGPKIEKKIIKESDSSAGGVEEKPNRSEDDMFSAATEFSDTGTSPSVTSDVKKVDEKFEVFDKVQDNATKDSVPLAIDRDEDKAKTLLEDFKDHKTVYSTNSSDDKHGESGSIVFVFDDKVVQESVHKSQTFDHEEYAFEENIVTKNLSEAEASHDKHSLVILGEIDHSVPVLLESAVSGSKDGVKVRSSETVVGEGSGKVLTGQDSGVGASFCSSSNSLEGIWGSVSDISDVFGKSEKRSDRSHAFKGPSLVESEEEVVEQKASNAPKSATNEDAISKVTNWSTSGHIATIPLRKLMGEAKFPDPKPSSSLITKDENAAESSQPGKSKLTQQTPVVNQESSPVINSGEGKLVKKKTNKAISALARFVCCSAPVTK